MFKFTHRELYWLRFAPGETPGSTRLEPAFIKSLKPGCKVLDLGCGGARVSSRLADRGYKVTGVDINKGELELAKKKYPAINFVLSKAQKLPLASDSFDAVIAMGLLGGIDKKSRQLVMAEIHRLLKVHGRLYVAEFARVEKFEDTLFFSGFWRRRYLEDQAATDEYGSVRVSKKAGGRTLFIGHHFTKEELQTLCAGQRLTVLRIRKRLIRTAVTEKIRPTWNVWAQKEA